MNTIDIVAFVDIDNVDPDLLTDNTISAYAMKNCKTYDEMNKFIDKY